MLNPWFVTGFCAGEGAFTYSRQGENFNLYFAVKLNQDEEEIIIQLQDFFGVGTIYKIKASPPKRYSGFTQPALYYRVSKIPELERIVEHFDEFPLIGKKLKSYNIWRAMFEEKKKFRKPDNIKLEAFAMSLSNLSNKNAKLRLSKQIDG
ncbi:MAG: LAGLIDADG family homing endonuclease [Candidatus Omnitrophota bacterium]